MIDFNTIPGEHLQGGLFDALSCYRFNQILVRDKNNFIMLGDDSRGLNDNSVDPTKAIVFVGTGGGDSIKKHVLGEGSVQEAVLVNDSYFLVNRMGAGKRSSQLIKSDLTFQAWNIVQQFAHSEIYNINFYSDAIAIASFITDDIKGGIGSEIRLTIDGGKTWKPANLSVSDGWGTFAFLSDHEITFIEQNRLMVFDFINGRKKIISEKIAPQGYLCDGSYIKDPLSSASYTYIRKKDNKKLSLINLSSRAVISLPPGADHIEVYGEYMYSLIKDGIYYNYVWTENQGKSWNTEKLEDFLVVPEPIGYYGKGFVYTMINNFKAAQSDKGARLGIRVPNN